MRVQLSDDMRFDFEVVPAPSRGEVEIILTSKDCTVNILASLDVDDARKLADAIEDPLSEHCWFCGDCWRYVVQDEGPVLVLDEHRIEMGMAEAMTLRIELRRWTR